MQHDHDHLSAPRISLLAPTTNHHDLASFLEHSRNIDSKTGTTVYRGTHYEYTVIEFLRTYNFTLRRTGRSNDLGIDLLGQWQLPSDPQELRVLVQCKASKPRPAMVRELEGAYVGAPAGWRGADVMALLITRDPATLGVRNALQRSRLPMGFAQITENGAMRQFMWNHAAQEARLTGMSVTNEYRRGSSPSSSDSSDSGVESAVSLQWMGKRWNDSENVSQTSI
ncbi:unnamed protein product [Zymoseptoria tritici ST99CH_1A5]|uniref:Restriction endonuclease type IV Mrr domain-containing protein n=2 Tax=Zymoseptoria tritici TaxID=1047171 RepID=A0A1Y6LUR3_ZYMTR|nr:unnamed protein product [Zymoseptoria tritici ST99CH_3D1]SMY28133.1 unnamed protein product [Zymoseptoria tritici ST99CH_1A5]